jgi:hypothetical protein
MDISFAQKDSHKTDTTSSSVIIEKLRNIITNLLQTKEPYFIELGFGYIFLVDLSELIFFSLT